MSMKVDSNKEKNLMNLSIIRCNKITIKKIKCLIDNMTNKYYIKIYSNNKKPQLSKIISFNKSKEIELNQTFPFETFQQKIIKEIKFELYNREDVSLLFYGIIINQNFIFDDSTGDYIIHLYDKDGNNTIDIYYSIEYTAIDSFEAFDKSVQFNKINNQNYLENARKNISQDENIKKEFIANLQYLEIIFIYFINIINWTNIIETLLFLIIITFIILYFQFFYIYIFPIYIVFFFIKNKTNIKDLLNSKNDPLYKSKNEAFFIKLQNLYNNFIESYEIFIQKLIAGKKSLIIELYKALILTIISNIILFYFNLFFLFNWKWLIIILIWVYFLSYNSFCVKIYTSLIGFLSSFLSVTTDNRYFNIIKPILRNIRNLLIPFYPLYQSFKEDNVEIYSSIVKSQGLRSSNSNELRLSKHLPIQKKNSPGHNLIKFELYENERWWVVVGWTKNLAGAYPTWCRVDKPYQFCDKTKIFLPNDENNKYQWSAEWKIEKNDNTDESGWEYADDFDSKFSKDDKFKYVRRRKWVRYANKL